MHITRNQCAVIFFCTVIANFFIHLTFSSQYDDSTRHKTFHLNFDPSLFSPNHSELELHAHISHTINSNVATKLQKENIDGSIFLHLDDDHFEEMGLTTGEKIKLRLHLNSLRELNEPTLRPTTIKGFLSTPLVTTFTQPNAIDAISEAVARSVLKNRPPPKPRLRSKSNANDACLPLSHHIPRPHIDGFVQGVYHVLEPKNLTETVDPTTTTGKVILRGTYARVVKVQKHKNEQIRGMLKNGLWFTLQQSYDDTKYVYAKLIKLHIVAVADKMIVNATSGKSACYLRENVQNYTGSPLHLYIETYDDISKECASQRCGEKEHVRLRSKWIKVHAMKNINQTFPNEDLILFMDAYDTLVTASSEDIILKFMKWKRRMQIVKDDIILFQGSDQHCYPFEQWHWNENVTYHIFGENVTGPQVCQWFRDKNLGRDPALNAGLYIGTARAVSDLMNLVWELRNEDNNGDQGMTQLATWFRKDAVWVDSNSSVLAWARRAMKTDPTMCHDNMHQVPPPVLHFTKGRVKKHLKMCRNFFENVYNGWKTIPDFFESRKNGELERGPFGDETVRQAKS